MTRQSQTHPFGQIDGQEITEITLQGAGGLTARVLTWGAVIRDLQLPVAGQPQSLVLGFDRLEDYLNHSPYFGALVGRYANRIAKGRFVLDGQAHQLDCNEGTTTLHGGRGGFSHRLWTLLELTEAEVLLGLTSPDGDQGFPGQLQAECRYTLGPDNSLTVALKALTDRPTPVNLTQHSYFNLDATADLRHHRLQVFADSYTPVDALNLPTGEIAPVDSSPFDFRKPRPLGDTPVDHNFVLSGSGFRPAAMLISDLSGVTMRVETTKPGLQVYGGHKIDVPVPGLHGHRYGPNAGLCLETQFFPDSPNQPTFPDTILRPGQPYSHRTTFHFGA
jgi:aldose 1-epimerase